MKGINTNLVNLEKTYKHILKKKIESILVYLTNCPLPMQCILSISGGATGGHWGCCPLQKYSLASSLPPPQL